MQWGGVEPKPRAANYASPCQPYFHLHHHHFPGHKFVLVADAVVVCRGAIVNGILVNKFKIHCNTNAQTNRQPKTDCSFALHSTFLPVGKNGEENSRSPQKPPLAGATRLPNHEEHISCHIRVSVGVCEGVCVGCISYLPRGLENGHCFPKKRQKKTHKIPAIESHRR